MDDLPEFDANSLFGNWNETKDDDNAAECSTTDVDGGTSGGGLTDSSKSSNLTSDYLNQILLDAAEKSSNGGDEKGRGGGGEELTTNNLLASSSTAVNNNFTFPMYYPLNQGGRTHPLAMTSMASCPPYATAAATTTTTAPPSASSAGHNITLESSGLQSLMSQQQPLHQHAQQHAQQLALATSFNAANNIGTTTSNVSSNNNNNNNITAASTLNYNSPYSTHLSELTANFRNNPNVNVHYGMAVNGFHPQVNARVNPVFPLSNNGRPTTTTTTTTQHSPAGSSSAGTNNNNTNQSRVVVVVGGRGNTNNNTSTNSNNNTTGGGTTSSCHTRNSRERNNREQVRAQKITQLISELRENMEQHGWQEEMKSKYQTLSQCTDYIEYLMKSHKEKEADIARTKLLVKEKVFTEASRCSVGHLASDSVTSSLTAFTTRSTSPGGSDSRESSSLSCEYQEHKDRKKYKKREEEEEGNEDGDDVPKPRKKERTSSLSCKRKMEEVQQQQQQQQSSTDSSYEDDEDNTSPRGRNISFHKTSSCVSEMTDSNKSCTTNNNTKGSTGSISSTAAVVRGVGSSQLTPSHHHRRRRRSQSPQREEVVSSNIMDVIQEKEKAMAEGSDGEMLHKKKKKRGFDYDYREVFLKSNVPQLIATLSGRIVVWNDFFLKATGLNKRDIARLTVFSIVQSNQLSTLYKMVARALAEQHVASPAASLTEPTSASQTSSEEDDISPKPKGVVGDGEDWQVVTLRCVRFPTGKSDDKEESRDLFLTITLMSDADRDQRCFHCTLTDTPSEGQFGTVSPKFLANMFAPAIMISNNS